MAEVKIEEIVYSLDGEFKKALDDTTGKFAGHVSYDRDQLFKFFLERVYHQCSVWEKVPDKCIKI